MKYEAVGDDPDPVCLIDLGLGVIGSRRGGVISGLS